VVHCPLAFAPPATGTITKNYCISTVSDHLRSLCFMVTVHNEFCAVYGSGQRGNPTTPSDMVLLGELLDRCL
jgi:hypothetical protein